MQDIHLWFTALSIVGALVLNTVLLTRWINAALHKLELKIQEERSARTDYFDRRIQDLKNEVAQTRGKYHEMKETVGKLELNIERKLNNYPSKTDIRDMLMPLTSKVETIHEELMRRGLKSTALQNGGGNG